MSLYITFNLDSQLGFEYNIGSIAGLNILNCQLKVNKLQYLC